jgi:hypothetical protein
MFVALLRERCALNDVRRTLLGTTQPAIADGLLDRREVACIAYVSAVIGPTTGMLVSRPLVLPIRDRAEAIALMHSLFSPAAPLFPGTAVTTTAAHHRYPDSPPTVYGNTQNTLHARTSLDVSESASAEFSFSTSSTPPSTYSFKHIGSRLQIGIYMPGRPGRRAKLFCEREAPHRNSGLSVASGVANGGRICI